MAKQLTREKIIAIDSQIELASIPYRYSTTEYPVEVIVAKLQKEQIFVPHYQRNFVWKIQEKSRFIESVFLGVPIMPFLVSVSGDEAELEIIDGSQRIRTLNEYVTGELKLNGLEKLTELNGTKFVELSETRKNKFLLRDFRFHVVTDKANNEVRADIFNRVNTSSNKLSSSEKRKGAYQGEFFNFITECAKIELFREVCPVTTQKANRGEYEELILRFFAYSESYLKFKSEVESFLDEYLLDKQRNGFNADELKTKLISVLDFVKKYFESFTRKGKNNSTPRVRFEALSVGVYLALQINPNLQPDNIDWIESKEFKKWTTSDAANNKNKLVGRMEFVRDCLLGVQTDLTYPDE
jgi:uncharacterized protein with ParB-like and HNH nuclease domain